MKCRTYKNGMKTTIKAGATTVARPLRVVTHEGTAVMGRNAGMNEVSLERLNRIIFGR